MKNALYSVKLTTIIIGFYGLVISFMLGVNYLIGLIPNKNIKNIGAIMILIGIFGFERFNRSRDDKES